MTRPMAKGRCPGAYTPMESGDGLLVRVRPHLGHLEAEQAFGLAVSAQRHGNGVIDLTSRANLQIRGVRESRHAALLRDLDDLGLLDPDPLLESRRNLVVAPTWRNGDDTMRVAESLTARLRELPELPPKFGFAIDAGPRPCLGSVSADIRVERAPFELDKVDEAASTRKLIVRADGASHGQPVTADRAVPAILALARWFVESSGMAAGRMNRHLRSALLPDSFTQCPPAASAPPPEPGPIDPGADRKMSAYGVAFGQLQAQALEELLRKSKARSMRVTPWRLFLLEDEGPIRMAPFIYKPGHPLMTIDACPGAPACASATVDTRTLAVALADGFAAPNGSANLHVSGCAKGCARTKAAAVTLVGRDGAFDLISNGCAWDPPQERGLTPSNLLGRYGTV